MAQHKYITKFDSLKKTLVVEEVPRYVYVNEFDNIEDAKSFMSELSDGPRTFINCHPHEFERKERE